MGLRTLLPRLVYKPCFLSQLSSSFPILSYTKEDVTIALNALVNGKYKSIRKAAIAFQIPSSTLHDQHKKSKSRTESHFSQQLLTLIEESTLENCI